MLNRALNRIKDILIREKADIANREYYYARILDSADTAIVVTDRNGAILRTNDEARRQLRLPVLTHLGQLSRIDERLPKLLGAMATGDRHLVKLTDERGEVTLSVRCSSIMSNGNELRIFAISEIGGELAEHEIESWIRLIRVLTHEIMNSITPITSLSETLLGRAEATGDVRRGLETIHATGRGLTAFVESYRKLTRLPEPKLELVDVEPLLEHAAEIVAQELGGVRVDIDVRPEKLILHADANLVLQVVVNLLKNAAQSLGGQADGRIALTAECPAGEQVTISVADNGAGIAPEILPHIFIPFFTTREHGSGIGLSISRQIMRLHGGSLKVRASGGDTIFSMLFP